MESGQTDRCGEVTGKNMTGNWIISKLSHRMESGASRQHHRKRHQLQITADQITVRLMDC